MRQRRARWLRLGVVLAFGAAPLAPPAIAQLGSVLSPATPVPAASQSAPQVMTDTPQYCDQLLSRLDAMVHLLAETPSAEITSLSDEGRKLCEQGQARSGIARVRRALVLLKRQETEP